MLGLSPPSLGVRVLWTSSLEARPGFYEENDLQLVQTDHSYESSKYQIDLVATHLDGRSLEADINPRKPIVRHFVVQPGVTSTNISNALIGWFLDFLKVMAFYLVRFY